MQGDLFSCHDNESLAHCISADARMGKGIAVLFKKKFGGVDDILSQGNRSCVLQSIPLIDPWSTLDWHPFNILIKCQTIIVGWVSVEMLIKWQLRCWSSVSQDFDHVYYLRVLIDSHDQPQMPLVHMFQGNNNIILVKT